MKNFIIIESDTPINAHVAGIINGKAIHVHLNGERVRYYEGSDKKFEIDLRIQTSTGNPSDQNLGESTP